MPNWVESYMEVTGPEGLVDECCKWAVSAEPFNKVLPMPEELVGSISPVQVVGTQGEADEINQQRRVRWGRLEEAAISEETFRHRMEQYGAACWYDWCVTNWGVKWEPNNCSVETQEPGRAIIHMTTAWSLPEGVYRAWEERGLQVAVMGLSEGESVPLTYATKGVDPYDVFYTTTEIQWF